MVTAGEKPQRDTGVTGGLYVHLTVTHKKRVLRVATQCRDAGQQRRGVRLLGHTALRAHDNVEILRQLQMVTDLPRRFRGLLVQMPIVTPKARSRFRQSTTPGYGRVKATKFAS